MIKKLKNIDEYIDFINKINSTDNYSDPMLSNEVQIKCNLLESVNCRLSFCMQPIINNIIKINEESPSNNLTIV